MKMEVNVNDKTPPALKSNEDDTKLSKLKDGGSSNSPERCAICLAAPENKAVTDSCMHAFCFSCLKEWSKVKAECPLCKNPFNSIIYNVRANDDYDKFEVPRPTHHHSVPDLDYLQRYVHWERETNHVVDRWMSSRIHEWRQRIQIDQENSRAAMVAATNVELIRRRRLFYRDGVQVSHVNNNKRVRDISSSFFHQNPSQVHRLVPWLKRELIVLFGANNMMLVNRLCGLILSAVSTLGIRSSDFYHEIQPYFLDRTDHFLKEFISFARSPHDIATYDSNAQYKRRSRRRHNRRSWSSDDEDDVTFPAFHRRRALPEPPPLAHVRNRISLERRRAVRSSRNLHPPGEAPRSPDEVVVISSSPEIGNRHSSPEHNSSDDEAVEFVKYIKPPHLRTPDAVIDLSSEEEEKPGPSTKYDSSSESTNSDSGDDVTVTLKSVVVPVGDCGPSTSGGATTDQAEAMSSSAPCSSSLLRDVIKTDRTPDASHSDISSCTPTSDRGRKPLHKVFPRKLSRASFPRFCKLYSSDSEDSDYVAPYIPPRKRHRKRHSKSKHRHDHD